jgi:uncharacterized protein (TIGR03545 family)
MSETSNNTQTQSSQPAPKGWVRWSGLGVFAGIVVAVVAIGYFSFTTILKSQLEHYASQAWGAKIEIGSLDLGIMPIEVGLRELQVTDPDKPMENLLVLSRLSASLNLYHLIAGRTVIEDVNFTGLAMHQPRDTSGALAKASKTETTDTAEKDSKSGGFAMPDMALPDPNEILAREKLETLEAANRVQAQLDEIDQAWSEMQKELPSDAEIQDYQKRFESLTGGKNDMQSILAKKDEFEKLQSELEAKKKTLEKAQDLLQNKLPKIQKDVVALKDLPEKDYNRLMSKYSLNQSGLSNVTYLLFGPQIQYWTDEGLSWYRKLEPFIAKLKTMQAEQAAETEKQAPQRAFGVDVAFPEYDPQPDFIIKRINGSGTLDWGDIDIRVRQVTFDHPTTRLPVLFEVLGKPKGQDQALRVIGESNFTDPQAPLNEANIVWDGYRISDWTISGDKTLPVVMQQGLVDVTGKVSLVGVDEVNAVVDMAYQDVAMDVSQSASKEVKRYIAPLFDEVKAFKVKADISGEVTAPNINASSNLDKLMSGAFNKVLGQELQQVKAEFQDQLNAKLQEQLGPINQQLNGLLGDKAELGKETASLDKMLNFDFESLVKEQAGGEAEKAVGDKLKNLFKF